MQRIKNIEIIMKILKKEMGRFQNPVATEISKTTRSPYMVLISCLLSLRTNDKITGPISKKLFEIVKTPHGILVRKYGGKVPDDFNKLMEFKGVGRKTANIVMTYGFFKKDYIAVDTHVNRIPNRLGWIKTKKPEDTEEQLKKILPKKYWQDFNDLIVTFGQNICRPIGPKCWECPVNKYCDYYKKVYIPSQKQETVAIKFLDPNTLK
ncbi:endonuclease III [Candidatus Woesearchaeota archaeon]|nr:endonuclease III [Candidatus Woesearchaeota archaeon]